VRKARISFFINSRSGTTNAVRRIMGNKECGNACERNDQANEGLTRKKKNIQELRVLLGVKTNKLVIYNNFKNKVLNHAVNEINKYCKINLKFTEIKEGRKVTGIRFEFKKSVQEKSK
jgi:hypothetical protein